MKVNNINRKDYDVADENFKDRYEKLQKKYIKVLEENNELFKEIEENGKLLEGEIEVKKWAGNLSVV